MTLQMPLVTLARPAATLALMAAVAVALSARPAPVRLIGVSTQGNAVLIEASEPVAYSVSRPDPLTVLVEMRNVSVADASTQVDRRDPVSAVKLEQASAVDGKSVARVRVSLSRPAEYVVRSARNTIRLELTPGARPAAKPAPNVAAMLPVTESAPPRPALAVPAPAATILERVRPSRGTGATTVTLSGNGRLTPASVSESADEPRRLVLEFPNLTSKVPSQTTLDSTLVKQVQVETTARVPPMTRVVMEMAPRSTYHVAQTGADGRDLAVVFEPAQSASRVMLTAPPNTAAALAPEPDIKLPQAIANAAAITPGDGVAPDPMSALEPVAPAARPVSAPPVSAPKPRIAVSQPPPSPAQPSSSPQPTLGQSTGAEKRYGGTPITLDFNGIDLRTVLRVFSEPSGLNIIIDPAVPATPVDILLKDLPWDQALELILKTHQLGFEAEGTVIRIATLKVLEEEQRQRSTLAQAKTLAGELQVQTFPLSYAKAADMQALLVKSVLSPRGQIQVDPRTNMLIITDLPDRLQSVAALIGTLDGPEPQVEIEARIITTTREFAHAIGVQWGLNGRMTPEIGNTTNLAFPNNGSLGGRIGPQGAAGTDTRANPVNQTGTVVGLPAPGAVTTAIGLALGSINGAFNLDLALTALERTGKGRILSTPRVTTQNNVEAEITQGVQIPVTTPGTANSPATVTFKDAALTLKVTPQITSANTVIMNVTIENASPGVPIQGIPSIDTQRAITRVQVSDGMTTVMGGIFVSRENTSTDRTPVLHRIPLLGWLFRRDTSSDDTRELLIFITPRIIRG